jgi:carboxyl-terminal processing protease
MLIIQGKRGLGMVLLGAALLLFPGSPGHGFPSKAGRFFAPPSVTHQVFQYVEWKYVDLDRAQPGSLLDGALKDLETRYPRILIDKDEGAGELVVRVDKERSTFGLKETMTHNEAATLLEEVLVFVTPLLKDETDEKTLRYMTINGALRELDPHSNIFSQKHYKDFKIRTSGSFGGIGFTFGIHEGDLTIISPIPDTPADRAGLQSGDRILFIDGEPTTNMGTDAAVGKMRGEPGTKVTLTIGREEWTEPEDFPIIRKIINIVSVEKFRLEGDGETPVLYVSIKNFQENTSRELRRAIEEGDSEEIAGLIIDFRNNPGGLLQQAIAVSDGFLDEGIIVSTRSRDQQKDPRTAGRLDKLFSRKPVVLLINRGSASASEIVAGALQESRSLVIGQKSFGKGSVQQAYQLMDGGGLLLTVSQYLTPGDISIQSIGIQPDIIVNPVQVQEGRLRLGPPAAHSREAALKNAFNDWGNAQREALSEIEYLKAVTEDAPVKEIKAPSREEKLEKLKGEFEVVLARRLLGSVDPGKDLSSREALLSSVDDVVASLSLAQKDRIVEAMSAVGVNWTPDASPDDAPSLSVTFPADLSLEAGTTGILTVAVKNEGDAPVHRVWGDTDSANPLLKNLDFAFGRIDPGEERLWSAEVEVPKSADDRWDTVTLTLKTPEAPDAGRHTGGILTRSRPLPEFAYTYTLSDENPDDQSLNDNGILEVGERARLQVTVRNVGEEESPAVVVNLHADAKENFYLDEVRHRLEKLAPGESRQVPLSFRLLEAKEDGEVEIRITLSDREHGKFFSDKLKFKAAEAYPRTQDRMAPRIILSEAPPLRTSAESVVLRLEVRDDESVKEVYAYRGDKKISYLRNGEGGPVFPVALEMPLEPGANRLVVFARDHKDILAQKVFFIHRADKGDEFSEALTLPPSPWKPAARQED